MMQQVRAQNREYYTFTNDIEMHVLPPKVSREGEEEGQNRRKKMARSVTRDDEEQGKIPRKKRVRPAVSKLSHLSSFIPDTVLKEKRFSTFKRDGFHIHRNLSCRCRECKGKAVFHTRLGLQLHMADDRNHEDPSPKKNYPKSKKKIAEEEIIYISSSEEEYDSVMSLLGSDSDDDWRYTFYNQRLCRMQDGEEE